MRLWHREDAAMRTWMLVILLLVGLHVSAARILIQGDPVELEVHEGFFTFPKEYTFTTQRYHYILLSGIERVCFLQEQPALTHTDMVSILIEQNDGDQIRWYCYRYSVRFFEIDF